MYHSVAQGYEYRAPRLVSAELVPLPIYMSAVADFLFEYNVEVSPAYSTIPEEVITVSAVWDKGALKSVISTKIQARLGLLSIDSNMVSGINTTQISDITLISMRLPNGLLIPDKRVFVCDLPQSIDMLIAMDIIQIGDFNISNKGGHTLFSFVIPSLPTPKNLALEADELNKNSAGGKNV